MQHRGKSSNLNLCDGETSKFRPLSFSIGFIVRLIVHFPCHTDAYRIPDRVAALDTVENSRWHKSSLSLLHREGYGGRLEDEGHNRSYSKAFLLLGNGVKSDMSRTRRKCYFCICWDPCLLALTCEEELHVYIKRTFPLSAVNQPKYLLS